MATITKAKDVDDEEDGADDDVGNPKNYLKQLNTAGLTILQIFHVI